MGLFKKIKAVYIINRFAILIFIRPLKFSIKMYNFLAKRWQPYGIVKCYFLGVEFKYFSRADDGLVNYFYYGLNYPESSDLELFLTLSKKCDVIFDIGANTGLFSILGSNVNRNAKIYAFEPYSVNYNRLKKNLEINKSNNVTPVKLAIGNQVGEISISVPFDKSITDVSSMNSAFSKGMYPNLNWTTENTEITTLDQFSNEIKLKINLIKCDVESFEVEVFNGASSIIRDHRPTIIFESFIDQEKQKYFNDFLKQFNYYVYLILEEGVVFCQEGFIDKPGFNYLVTPVKPEKTFISFNDENSICDLLIK